MDEDTLNKIRKNKLIYNYLREDSSHYKYLYRDKKYIKTVEKLAKEKYKETINDKLDRISNTIELLTTFFDVLK